MRVFNGKEKDVEVANLLAQSEFSITDGSKLIEMILDNAYKDPITATVREICQNASEVDPNFTVHLPTDIEPWLAIVDNGTGMSHDDVITYASGLGASTKDGDNTKVGGFGIGMKVPFTMSDQYLIISRYEGKIYTFSAYKDEAGKAQLIEMKQPQDTDEHNGIEVRVPVKADDFTLVRDKLIAALSYFDPKPETNTPVEWEEIEYVSTGKDWGLIKGHNNYYRERTSRVIMGNLWYAIDKGLVSEKRHDSCYCILDAGIDLHMDIGSLKLPLSREGILYNDKTLSVLRAKLDEVCLELVTGFEADIEAQPTLWDAMKVWSEAKGLINNLSGSVDITRSGIKMEGSIQIPAPITDSYLVNSYKFRLKSMTMTDYRTSSSHLQSGQVTTRLSYSNSGRIILIAGPKTKRMPSRLLAYMKASHPDKDAWVFQYPEGGEYKLKTWLKRTLGELKPVSFETEVPDVSTATKGTAAVKRKTAKVTIFNPNNGGYYDNKWEDAGDLNMDTNTGIYVDTRRGEMNGCKYLISESDLAQVLRCMKHHDLIPEGTIMYGCPGSHKNKLEGHVNFMHIDEAIDLALELGRDLITPTMTSRYNYLQSMDNFVKEQSDIFMLDIDINKSYYNRCKQRVRMFRDTVQTSKDYLTYKGCRMLYDMIRIDEDKKPSNYTDHAEKLKEKFYKRYPLFAVIGGYHTDYDKNAPHIEEYIKLKEYCNV